MTDSTLILRGFLPAPAGTPLAAVLRKAEIFAVVIGALAVSGCRDTGNNITNPNQPPGTPVITAPAEGSTHAPGAAIGFQGSALDPEDGSLSGESLVWTSSRDGQIGSGASVTADDLSEGLHMITLRATDSGGLTSLVSISILIENSAPQAGITAPNDGASFAVGGSIAFEGSGTDPDDGALTGPALSWSSDLDGPIGIGESFSRNDLSEGTHTITLTASDSHGATGTATVTIRVANQEPEATISNPAGGSTFIVGNPIGFQGSATDVEDGPIPAGSLVWRSNRHGQIGTGASFQRSDLSLGVHTITLEATDSDGGIGTASITISVLGPPAATIDLPTPGGSFAQGTNVTFQGSATDPEDGDLAGPSLVWTSDRDGQIGIGTTFGRPDLSVGIHRITLTATDSHGLKAVVSANIRVTGAGETPIATIAAPTNGAVFAAGSEIVFEGSAADDEDGALTGGSLVWSSSRDGQIGTGGMFTRSNLSLGSHTITLRATDSDALVGTAQVAMTVVGGPQVTITSPASGTAFVAGTSIGFQGSATDPEDGTLTGASLVWTSDKDGQMGTGTSFNKSDLSLGVHTVTVTATDSDTFSAMASITVTIQAPGFAPVASITSPTTGSTFNQGEPIAFAGTGMDAQDGALVAGSLVWTSSRDGQIGTGTSFNRSDLSLGTHTITLTAKDSDTNTGTASVVITVQAGSPPNASISSPANGTAVNIGTSVSFQGTGNDPDDGPLGGGSLVWTSSLDGQIGTGNSFSRSALSVGTHTITLTATDSDGITGTASITLTVSQVSPILIKAGNTASSNIAVGGQVTIPIVVDMSQAGGLDIASLTISVTWDSGVASYVGWSDPNGSQPVPPNESGASTGSLQMTWFSVSGRTSTFPVIAFTFSGNSTGTTNFSVSVQAAGDELGNDLIPSISARSHGLTVGS